MGMAAIHPAVRAAAAEHGCDTCRHPIQPYYILYIQPRAAAAAAAAAACARLRAHNLPLPTCTTVETDFGHIVVFWTK
eukprot:COSAG01_NODE_6107_length_3846_cov_1.891113_3_plen_78_part_00